jgi:hypothetical protein
LLAVDAKRLPHILLHPVMLPTLNSSSDGRPRGSARASLAPPPPYAELRGDVPQLRVLTHLVSLDAPTAASPISAAPSSQSSLPPVVVSTSIYDVEQPEYR